MNLVRSAGVVVALAFAVLAAVAAPARAADPRTTVSLETGWRFKQADGLSGVETPGFDDQSWTRIDLPHTWNRIGNAGVERSPLTNDVQGVGWYRLRFTAPAAPRNGRYFLQFDGVGAVADVWLNGRYLGKHSGAFSRFRFDATSAIRPSKENLLVVKADNSKPAVGSTTENVLPLSGDFFVFGGIYRKAALVVTAPAHIDMMDFGGPGLYAHAVSLSGDDATVQVVGRLANDGPAAREVSTETDILDAGGRIVASATSAPIHLSAAGFVVTTDLHVAHPHLWNGMQDPYLYRTVLILRSKTGAVLDTVSQPLGLRSMSFDADKGFFLNGKHLFLKGVSRHQDRPVKGWAISEADQSEDFDILTDMGANALRMPHYQYDQYAYDQADTRGLVVWTEIPLVDEVSFNGTPANAALTANARQQLTELIRQNYNHPSIAVWSIANEIDNLSAQKKGPSHPAELLRDLAQLAQQEDPSRPSTLADCCEDSAAPDRDVVVGLTQTLGYNRYFGWYRGQVGDLGPALDRAHAAHPTLPFSVSEYGAGAALTQHSDDPQGGPINPHGRPHPEEYQNWIHEQSWSQLKDRSYIWGVFIWNMFDFSSNGRKEGDLTGINEKGLVSYDRQTRKDAFYFYRANWNASPTLHLVGSRYLDRAYSVIDVKAYSNAKQARLWLNGADLGPASCAGGICLWSAVHLAPGDNTVTAKADFAGTALSDTVHWRYAGNLGDVRIKAGDIAGYVAADGERYGSDAYFTGGAGKGISPPDTPAQSRVSVAGPDARLYDSYREGAFIYRVPAPNGRYSVVARFAEPTADGPGQRVFDVAVNGVTAIKNLDVFAEAHGRLKSIDRTFPASAVDGEIVIEFRPVQGSAIVSALSVTPAP